MSYIKGNLQQINVIYAAFDCHKPQPEVVDRQVLLHSEIGARVNAEPIVSRVTRSSRSTREERRGKEKRIRGGGSDRSLRRGAAGAKQHAPHDARPRPRRRRGGWTREKHRNSNSSNGRRRTADALKLASGKAKQCSVPFFVRNFIHHSVESGISCPTFQHEVRSRSTTCTEHCSVQCSAVRYSTVQYSH